MDAPALIATIGMDLDAPPFTPMMQYPDAAGHQSIFGLPLHYYITNCSCSSVDSDVSIAPRAAWADHGAACAPNGNLMNFQSTISAAQQDGGRPPGLRTAWRLRVASQHGNPGAQRDARLRLEGGCNCNASELSGISTLS